MLLSCPDSLSGLIFALLGVYLFSLLSATKLHFFLGVFLHFITGDDTDQKAKIEQTAQAILDARVLYPDASLADLYDETAMPPELRKAHQQNDKAVMQAYGFSIKDMTESKCVAELMRMYQKIISNT